MLPAPVLRYIKRVKHQQEFNTFLLESENAKEHDCINPALNNFQIHVSSQASENIFIGKGCIVYAITRPVVFTVSRDG
ncbi:MAG: hypothetical protein M3R17_01815 [Bacteroidota bacterium]|nr:hypothetical protein [Bacteroidota bacterium]